MTLPNIKVTLPGQTIGIIGGGQLGRMMAIAARYMGYKIAVLDPTPNCPTAQVADQQIVAAYDDMEAIKEFFIQISIAGVSLVLIAPVMDYFVKRRLLHGLD